MTEMFGEAWSPMTVPDLAPDDDDDDDTDILFIPIRCFSLSSSLPLSLSV